MWEKIKNWWNDRKERRLEKQFKKALQLEIAVNQLLEGGPNWTAYNIHRAPTLLCSVYFESNKDWTVVDFSRENEGIVHYMLFTPKPITEYKSGSDMDPNKKEIHSVLHDATVFMKYYADGSEGWCFSL